MRGLSREDWLFALLLLVHLVPIWALPIFPSEDGPSHLETAHILLRYSQPEAELLRAFYTVNAHPSPNWLGHLGLMLLLVVLPAIWAEKVLLSAYVLLLPLSARYALRGVAPEAGFLAVLAFPFTFNSFLHMGFYNFCLSLPLFFLAVGQVLRHPRGPSRAQAFRLAALCTGLYFAHIVSFLMAFGVALGVVSARAAALVAEGRKSPHPFAVPTGVSTLGAFLPGLLLMSVFLRSAGGVDWSPEWRADRWTTSRLVDSFVSFEGVETWLAQALLWTLVAVAVYVGCRRLAAGRIVSLDVLFGVAATYLALYSLAPDRAAGGSYLSERLLPFALWTLLLWFGTAPFSSAARRVVQASAACLALSFVVLDTQHSSQLQGAFQEYLSAGPSIERNSTLLPLCYSRRGILERRPSGSLAAVFLHTAGYLAVDRDIVELTHYEGHRPHFPVAFRPALNPYLHLGDVEGEPPCVDIPAFTRQTGRSIDYVLVWSRRRYLPDEPCDPFVRQQLKKLYAPVFVSQPRGLAVLYRLKPSRAAEPEVLPRP